MQIDELCHALAVEIESTDLDIDNTPSTDTILDSCLGLVIIDKEKSTFRLIHYSLQEYLSDHNIFPRAHQTLAETCLTCLNFSQANLSVGPTPNLRYTSFLEYCFIYWGTHAKMQPSYLSKELILKLFNRFENSISPKSPSAHDEPWRAEFRAHFPFTVLHYACRLGIIELVTYLIGIGCEVNGRDPSGKTPLQWAAGKAHDAVVRLLLELDNVNPDETDNEGRTALSEACRYGHEEVVRLLLAQKNVNPNEADKYGNTPLISASSCGHEGVVRLLLERGDVDPNKSDKEGETTLHWASFLAHDGVMRLLLRINDVDPDKPDKNGRTPLWQTMIFGNEEAARLLLPRADVNPNKPDKGGHTPLLQASLGGHEGAVRLLLSRDDINPDSPNNDGQTPLMVASSHGNEGVVRLLLARAEVNPSTS